MRRAAWLVLALCVAAGAAAQPAPAPKAAAQAQKAATKAPRPSRPAWAELTAEQQQILAPLKNDWETLDGTRKRKWIAIAKRYPKLAPPQQERVQQRMHEWVRLTPEQRRVARESYKNLAKSQPAKRGDLREQWAQYQALSPMERESLVPPAKPAKKKKKP
ncbi:MAG TPA: DUF3106 domain-containing protein [Burkholderiales bacterium]|nr:DUF3106 domain-containing protein [Burkholderiales bacterium]